MSRHDELTECLVAANAVFQKHKVMCHASVWAISDELNSYLGAKVVGYVAWEKDTASTQSRKLAEVAFWANEEVPEMIVGLTIKISTPVRHGDAEFRRLFRLSLKPSDEKVVAAIDENVCELVIADANLTMKFHDHPSREKFLHGIFQTLKKEISVPMHMRSDRKKQFGFGAAIDANGHQS